jgi:hypothetical protein
LSVSGDPMLSDHDATKPDHGNRDRVDRKFDPECDMPFGVRFERWRGPTGPTGRRSRAFSNHAPLAQFVQQATNR